MLPAISIRHRQYGFTLLEVLVALAIVAFALLAIIKTTSETTANIAYLRDKTLAQWVALDRLAELRSQSDWPTTGIRKDEIEQYGVEWQWIQEISETSEEHLRRVDISVIFADTGDEESPLITISGFLPDPAILESNNQKNQQPPQ